MENILEELWYGNIDPQSQSKEKNKTVQKLLALMGFNRDKLFNSMSPEQQETLEKYDDSINEIHGFLEEEIFSYAFRLGGKFMLAILTDK